MLLTVGFMQGGILELLKTQEKLPRTSVEPGSPLKSVSKRLQDWIQKQQGTIQNVYFLIIFISTK